MSMWVCVVYERRCGKNARNTRIPLAEGVSLDDELVDKHSNGLLALES